MELNRQEARSEGLTAGMSVQNLIGWRNGEQKLFRELRREKEITFEYD